MPSISIPEPCHENWADFTPTQKGAFCGSCQIDVVDFSNKTPEEVKAILKENAGKHMCGRFRKSQLDDLNNDFYQWENQSVKTFQSKFLYACLIVFGMTLFTSCDVSEQSFLGEITTEWHDNSDEAQSNFGIPAAIDQDTDTTKKPVEKHYKKGKVKYEPEEILMGKPAIQIEEDPAPTPPDSLDEEICFIKGDVVVSEVDLIDSLVVQDTLVDETIMGDTILWTDEMVDGEIRWEPEFDEFIEDTTKTEESMPDDTLKSTVIEERHVKGEIRVDAPFSEELIDPYGEEGIDSSANVLPDETIEPIELSVPAFDMVFESMLFPNPVIDQTTVVINVNKLEKFSIYLYAINGKMVKDIYNGMLASGRQEFIVDLTKYEAGSYLIVINAGKQKESLKLEKLH